MENPKTDAINIENQDLMRLYAIDDSFSTISKNVLSRYNDGNSAMINRILLEFQKSYKTSNIDKIQEKVAKVNAVFEPIKKFFNYFSGVALVLIIIFILVITISPTFSPPPHWLNILVTSVFLIIGLVSISLFFMAPSFYLNLWGLEENCDIDPEKIDIPSSFFNFSMVIDGKLEEIDLLTTCEHPPSILEKSYNRMKSLLSEGDAIKNIENLDFSCSAIIGTLKRGENELCDRKNDFHTTRIAFYSSLTFLQFGGFLIAFGAGRLLGSRKEKEDLEHGENKVDVNLKINK